MKILVTGGAGFIGSHLVSALLLRGENVVVIDDFNDYYDPALKRENIEAHLGNPRLRLFETDITDYSALADIIRDEAPGAVCHLAARAGVRPSIKDPLLYERVNTVGTLNMLEAVKDLALENFLFASSSSVYGINSKVPFSEDDPVTSPISPYAVTKRAGELTCRVYAHIYSVPITCLRFFTVYGERGRPDMAVAKFTRAVWEGRDIEVYGDGTAKRDFTFIDDIISGVLAALYNPKGFEIINLGGSRTIEVSGLISIIEEKLGKKARIRNIAPVAGDVPVTYADVTRASRLLGFEPRVRLEEGVERYVKWFLERERTKGGLGAEGAED